MKKPLLLLLLLSLALPAAAQEIHTRKNKSTTIQRTTDGTNCQEHFHFSTTSYREVVFGEETQSYPNQPIKITAAHNGGIAVRQGDGPNIEITVCKAAGADSAGQAEQVLQQVRLVRGADGVTVEGPERSEDFVWTTSIMVAAPRGAQLELHARNGGISVTKVDGSITARTQNGGISVNQTSGQVDLEAVNGGVSIKDPGGSVRARVQNGGISIQLAQGWQGGNVDATSRNGGISVHLPENFSAPVEIRSGRRSGGLTCSSAACQGAQRTVEGEQQVLRIGYGEPVIRAATQNGGVSIRDGKASSRRSEMY